MKNETKLNIPWARPRLWGNEQRYVAAALSSTWISGGEYVDRLESEFARYCGVPHALSSSNGTTALHLVYLAASLQPGDEIVVPGFGFLAAANIALLMKLRPVFAEVDPHTWCLTAAAAERCLTPRTKAIVPIHTYGNVCAMDELVALGGERGIAIVEDAAEAFPSRYRGKPAGTFGDFGTFSFQATKTITTGEGGMVLTRDAVAHQRMALYRSHGMLRKRHYWHEVPGHNFRLTNLQAALGCAQLENLAAIIADRAHVYSRYRDNLSRIPGVALQQFGPEVDAVVWAVAMRLDPHAFPQGRDAVMAQMGQAGIETRPGFYAPSMIDFYDSPALPVCEALSREVLSVPTFPGLGDEQIDLICEQLSALRR